VFQDRLAASRRIRLHAHAAANGFVAASTGTVESAVSRALARIPAHRVRHAREVLSAVAEALNNDRGTSAAASSKRPSTATEREVNQSRRRVAKNA
jgi:hypothetical protein